MYIPRNHPFARKVVERAHHSTLHGGVGMTMAKFRELYWIPRLRQLVKRVRTECWGCKRFRAKSYEKPPPGKLPSTRTKGTTPFEVLDVDYGKPFWTKAVEFFSDGREFSRTVENFLGRSRIFSDGREFSRTVENFLGRSRIFSDGREFSRTVENFLGRSRIFSDGREFSRTVENLLGRSRIFSDGREFSRTVENFLGRSRIFSDDREFSRTVENFLGRSRIYSDGREFTRTIENFLGRSRIFSDGREFTRTVEILNFLRQSRMRQPYVASISRQI